MPQVEEPTVGPSPLEGGGRLQLAPEADTRQLLARLIEEAKPAIQEEWFELLSEQGLSHQRQVAREDPLGTEQSYLRILGTICAWLTARDEATESHTREAMLSLYRGFGGDWGRRAPAPIDPALAPPRIIQAIRHVHLRRNLNRLTADEFYRCAIVLDQLAMDLGLARVHGYLEYREQVLAQQRQTVSHLLDELTNVESRQRHAIALDLHDNLAQRLASLLNGIQHCEHVIDRDVAAARGELTQLRQVAGDALRDARAMIRDLHFGFASQDKGLAALPDYLADLDADTGIRHEARICAVLPALPLAQQSLVLRVIQEALTNAHKHAQATTIVVSVTAITDRLEVEVSDNGCGFIIEDGLERAERRGRMGIIGMRERADLLNGSLEITSVPSVGTSIRLTVPLVESSTNSS